MERYRKYRYNRFQWSIKYNFKKGTGTVTAEAGGLKAAINVIVGQDSMVIDNFEHNDLKRYNIDGYIGGTSSIASGVSKSGVQLKGKL